MDCKTPYIKIFLWLFLFFQKVDFKFTTQEKHENITFLGITFLSDHLQKWQTPFWNRLNELHLIISFVCHKQLVLYHKKCITCLGQTKVLCLPAVCLLLPLRDTWYNHLEGEGVKSIAMKSSHLDILMTVTRDCLNIF